MAAPNFMPAISVPAPTASPVPGPDPAQAQQTTDTILMVSPADFKFNEETAKSNLFQKAIDVSNDVALQEFNSMVDVLRNNNIRVIVMPSKKDADTPDSIFPNNWFSVHATGEELREKALVLYPMFTENRRTELQPSNLINLLKTYGICITETVDLSSYADESLFLEGTGSLVLDRRNKIAYAAVSPRTDPKMVDVFAEKLNYKPVMFHSRDRNGRLIYHTNVMMSVASEFAVVALESVSDAGERGALTDQLVRDKKEIVAVTLDQVENMAGNILEVKSTDGKAKIVMSRSAYNAFTPGQRETLSKYGDLVAVNIDSIETVGGGSARCMMAEIF